MFKLLNIQEDALFSDKTVCQGAHCFMSQGGGELKYSKWPSFETKDTIDLKTYQEINF